jgi:hypothetical protein
VEEEVIYDELPDRTKLKAKFAMQEGSGTFKS